MSDLLKIIKQRRSIRRFKRDAIPEAIIEKLKQALIWAPSAGNLQSRKFYFVFNQETKEWLACHHKGTRWFVAEAPLVIVGCADEKKIEKYGECGQSLFVINDVSLSIQNAMLVAADQGLGSCWVGLLDEGKVRKILKLPKHLRPIVILPIGYAKEAPEAKERSSQEAVVEVR
ncbi:nitroreductase [Candidatus Falkowbacteria bacterium RIFCSPLOWO2_12_FULL_45_13]|uniref:Nitroreductase n=2 Tax=Candidatus Falkowiibacteriota TaxID=1752728 RepID=A0A1F5SBU2_9BACT|nr:MAG: nitroreductase [Candidatus Falkowbacteria bacterium RIFCSPLOWO2_02_FULL_45_21]OGF30563.1 MAG: nitroreductase [Candidatus Falkowbacteria bacterium RIFCSPLOWO2_12_FULL_45_13]